MHFSAILSSTSVLLLGLADPHNILALPRRQLNLRGGNTWYLQQNSRGGAGGGSSSTTTSSSSSSSSSGTTTNTNTNSYLPVIKVEASSIDAGAFEEIAQLMGERPENFQQIEDEVIQMASEIVSSAQIPAYTESLQSP